MTLCLDERHCGWMSEAVMERVILALKDRIGPKLNGEAKEGREKVDVYRGMLLAEHVVNSVLNEGCRRWLANGLLLSQELIEACRFVEGVYTVTCCLLLRTQAEWQIWQSKHLEQPGELDAPPAPESTNTRRKSGFSNAKEIESNTAHLDGADLGEDPFDLDIGHSPESNASDAAPVQVKAEPDEETDTAALFAAPPSTRPDEVTDTIKAEEEEVKEEVKPDIKPKVCVTYKGFSIFGRTLVVVSVRIEILWL